MSANLVAPTAAWVCALPPRTALTAESVASEKMRLLLQMPDSGRDVTLEYSSATVRFVWTPIGTSAYWLRWRMRTEASGMWSVLGVTAYFAYRAWHHDDPAVTYLDTWSTVSTGLALGGGYRSTTATGRRLEFTVTGITDLYIAHPQRTTGTAAYVLIDGATTLVNELPLVGANRELSCYAAVDNFNVYTLVASGLDAAQTYTVRVTSSGVVGPGGNTFVAFSGFATESGPTDSRADALINSEVVDTVLADAAGVWEYAYAFQPSGALAAEFTGLGHGNEAPQTLEWLDENDDPVVVDAVTTRAGAQRLTVRQTAFTRHSETAATNHAEVILEHRFHSQGFDCYHEHTWLTAGVVGSGLVAMFTLDDDPSPLAQVAADAGVAYDLTPNDGTLYGHKQSRLAAFWSLAHPYIAWLYLPDLVGVNNWLLSNAYLYVQDREVTVPIINKIYAERVGFPDEEDVAPTDVWESTAYYRVSRIPAVALPFG